MAFLKIDQALGEYYAGLGKDDYYDASKQGKFFKYCDENGFEEDDIDEEFANEPADCMYVEFDEEFPLNPPIEDIEARLTEIVRIIKYCHEYGKAPTANDSDEKAQSLDVPVLSNLKSTKNVFDIKINTDATTQKECGKIYRKQCPLLFKDEDVLKRCFAIWKQNNNYPFLVNLVDSYSRDKALYKYKENKNLSMMDWRTKSKYFQKLNKEQKTMAEKLASGVQTYLHRGCTSWYYGPARIARIQDSMRDIVSYILVFYKFIVSLTEQDTMITPFQLDIPIALRKVKLLNFMIDDHDDEEDNSEDDSDDADEKAFNIDMIGDIEERLNGNKLGFYSFEMKRDLNATALVLRDINAAFKIFKNDKLSYKNYPQRRRFCVFVDRRDDKEGDNKLHKITMFEPPSSCSEIPHDHVPEWYFHASKTCIIPSVKPDDKKSTMKADSIVNGQLMTISFQVEAHDVIKVYIYWMGQYTRIYPQDLSTILPDIFDIDSCKNDKWDEQQQDAALKQMRFNDADFEAFYHQVSYGSKRDQFPKQYD